MVPTIPVCKECQYQIRNKRKDWQPESGLKHIRWSISAHQVGTRCPYCGRRVPKASGDFWALLASRRPRYYTWCFMTISWWYYDDLVILLCQFHDTSMRHFCKIIRKYHSSIFLYIRYLNKSLGEKMRLWDFFHAKTFICAYKKDCKSKKYLIWNLIDTSKNYVPT